jgi:type I restriction enzyme M protein
MLGAIIGDVVGSVYEFNNIRTKDFPLFRPSCFFTDDTVMTIATYKALKACKGKYKKLPKMTIKYKQFYGAEYPNLSYGKSFGIWLNRRKPLPYNSYGNGAAMSVSPVAYFAQDIEQVKDLSYKVTAVTHNHPEGIKGAEATAVAIWLAKNHYSKEQIKEHIEKNYYSLDFNYEDLVKNYQFNETCQKTVPQAIYCFLISENFEDAIRTGISIGGDSDTLCAIIGAIAEAYYGIPEDIKHMVYQYLDDDLMKIVKDFQE